MMEYYTIVKRNKFHQYIEHGYRVKKYVYWQKQVAYQYTWHDIFTPFRRPMPYLLGYWGFSYLLHLKTHNTLYCLWINICIGKKM